MKNENKNYEIRKDSQKIIIGVHLFPGKDYGIEYIQIKLTDIQAALETLKNIDHDPSEEGNGHEGDGRVVNKLFFNDSNSLFYFSSLSIVFRSSSNFSKSLLNIFPSSSLA